MHYAYVGTPNNRDHASNPFWGLDSQLSPGDGPREAVRMLDLVESTLVKEALTITKGNQLKAAEILGVNRATLRKKMPDS